ncbi:thioesterase II family protein [Pseudomonas akapageensis]|uniref:thioesterase II family protein n=1 Tax=Pseudomonas akapageensis TaxID=2609961 RepID=UPI0031B5E02D
MVKLFCFPYAGASAQFYARWRRGLPAWLDVRPVELPGRGARFGEPLHEQLMPLVEQLVTELRADIHTPYAFFGHSMGALIAFEVTHALRRHGLPQPEQLFLSGASAPGHRDDERYARLDTDAGLVDELRRLGGTAAEVIHSPELMAMVLPVLRADFRLCTGYGPVHRPPLTCALHVLGGDGDYMGAAALQAWRSETRGTFSCTSFVGDHFFLHAREAQVLDHLCTRLARLRRAERVCG